MSATPENLPYCRILFRSKEGVELFSIPSERADEASITQRTSRQFLLKGNTSFQALLPDGSAAFVQRPDKGIFKIDLKSNSNPSDEAPSSDQPFLKETGRVQIMAVSPQGTYLLTWERAQEGEIPNLKVWDSSTGEMVIGFRQKSLSRYAWPYVQWTNDEKFAFLLCTNEVRVYPGTFPQQASTRYVDRLTISGIASLSVPSEAPGSTSARILFTSFCPKDKNKPARAALHQYPSKTPAPSNAPYPALMTRSLFQADEMRVYWSPKGDCALIALQTAVDTSGQSYYGSTSLYHMSPQESDAIAVPLPQEGPVLDVAWMPNPTKPPCFAVVAGRMPTMASLHNGNDGKPIFLFGNAHRNTIAWAPHGRFVNLAGFGNLAGGMAFWDRNKMKQLPPAAPVTASCTVGYGWSPDSRLFLACTTSPRMNVDNGVHIYRYNGDKMTKLPWNNDDYKPDRLLEASFVPVPFTVYPDRPQSPSLKDAPTTTNGGAAAYEAPKPTARYVPPSARGRVGTGTSLAERLRAEKEGKMLGAQKVADKPKQAIGVTGKVVVGMAPPSSQQQQGKSKNALRREKAKQKKEEEEALKALEEKVESTTAPPSDAPNAADAEKRARKIKKTLKQIDDLKARDPSSLDDDQKKKVATEKDLRDELAKLGIE